MLYWVMPLSFNFLAFKADIGLWNDCLQLLCRNWPFGYYKSCLWMLEKHVWMIWHPNVQVCSSSYHSGLFGLFGLETLKYWNHQLLDTKRCQNHEKIINFSYFGHMAFEMAFMTFVGLFLVFNRFSMSHKASGTRQCQINEKI